MTEKRGMPALELSAMMFGVLELEERMFIMPVLPPLLLLLLLLENLEVVGLGDEDPIEESRRERNLGSEGANGMEKMALCCSK